jgi:deoxyribodipyrimidine photo-lyase
MSDPVVIHWFRQDLRLADNPSLSAAARRGPVLPVFILDDESAGAYHTGGAGRWWLHHSLRELNGQLGGGLRIFNGAADAVLIKLAEEHQVKAVHWNRCYEPWRIRRDEKIKAALKERGVEARSFNGSLLWEPWEVLKSDDTPYKVFTPFFRRGCLNATAPRRPLPAPEELRPAKGDFGGVPLEGLGLLPRVRWDEQLEPHWRIGEEGAALRLQAFLAARLHGYKDGRNFPARDNVSRLSPHLHWGEVSPNQVWHAAREQGGGPDTDHFLSELGWREFAHSLLYHFPELPRRNLQAKFDRFPWLDDADAVRRWQRGLTGCPIVDAGMRELWRTGYMHNRVRMIVGSFLVKNLLQHWHHGEAWFRDCLVDADLANNSAGWQWIAGCGADAAPFFRIFNPVAQGEKFDKTGAYTRRFVPELKDLPDKYLFRPWEAPPEVLDRAGVRLGDTYPQLMIDLKESRARALEAFRSLKEG